jgi:3-phosphoshikimate 1-carboxyvinyltransferase
MAMAAAVLGLRVPGVVIENVETTAKTLPGFAARWTRMLDGDGLGGR